jgi:MFS family permease
MIRATFGAAGLTILGMLPVFLLSTQSSLVREDLRFGEAQLGLVVSVFFAASAISSLAVGAVFARWGRRRSTAFGAGLACLSSGGLALTTFTYPTLVVMFALSGVANAALQTTANMNLAWRVPAARQGLAFSIKQSAAPSAIILGGLALPSVGVLLGWRWSYGAVALACAIGLASTVCSGSRWPESRSLSSEIQAAPTGALRVSAMANALASGALNAMAAFLPAWAFELDFDPETVGALVAVAASLSVTGRIVSGIAADRRGGRNLPLVALQFVAAAVALTLLSLGHPSSLIVGTLVAFAFGWSWPGLLLYAIVRVARDAPGSASATLQAGAFTGAASGPLAFGLLVATVGYSVAWCAGAIALILAAVLLVVARRMFIADRDRRQS